MMKKIIYFDYWEKGYRNFLRLDSTFKTKGYDTFLLHVKSWSTEINEKESFIDGMLSRDISYYKENRIYNILKQEQPEAVIMLNLSFMLDRAIATACKDLGVKIFYLAHGVVVDAENTNSHDVKRKDFFGLFNRVSRKNILSLYNYLSSLKSLSQFFSFANSIVKDPSSYTLKPRYSKELKVSKSLVYYEKDKNTLVHDFKFPEDEISVVGNPELDAFYHKELEKKDSFCEKIELTKESYVAYLDDGFDNTHGWTLSKWHDFLQDLNDVVTSNNHLLAVKLHPRRDVLLSKDFFEGQNIFYYKDIDFKNFIYHSSFVVSHFSSVIVYAFLLNKKVKSPRWGESKGVSKKFDSDLVQYYDTKDNFIKSFLDVNKDDSLIKTYVKENMGIYDGKSIKRIVNIVTS